MGQNNLCRKNESVVSISIAFDVLTAAVHVESHVPYTEKLGSLGGMIIRGVTEWPRVRIPAS